MMIMRGAVASLMVTALSGSVTAFVATTGGHRAVSLTTSLNLMPDQNAGWMNDEPFGMESVGTQQRQQQPRPNINTEPGQPLARPGGRDYYPPKTEARHQPMTAVPPPRPGLDSDQDISWYVDSAGTDIRPDQPPMIGSANRRYEVGVGPEAAYPRKAVTDRSPTTTVQGGGSRRAFDTSHQDQSNVVLGSSGRPVYANVQVWQGPNNTPASMKLYSEDGLRRPWTAGFQNTNRGVSSSQMDVRNTGPLEFPVQATIEGTTQIEPTIMERMTVQGESLKTFSVSGDCQAVYVELHSEGRPMFAQIELWQGPNNIQQCAEVYSDNGVDRTWSATIPTPGYSCTIAIRNIGPMAYPIKAAVGPMY